MLILISIPEMLFLILIVLRSQQEQKRIIRQRIMIAAAITHPTQILQGLLVCDEPFLALPALISNISEVDKRSFASLNRCSMSLLSICFITLFFSKIAFALLQNK